MHCLTDMFKVAVCSAISDEEAKGEGCDFALFNELVSVDKAIASCAVIGLPAQHVWLNVGRLSAGPTHESQAVRRCNNRLAMLHEAYKQANRGDTRADRARPSVDPNLIRRLWPRDAPTQLWQIQQKARQEIQSCKADRKRLEDAQRLDRVRRWRAQIATTKSASKWFKRKDEGQLGAQVDLKGQVSQTDAEAASLIADFWQEQWRQGPLSSEEAQATAAQTLLSAVSLTFRAFSGSNQALPSFRLL